MVAAWLVPVVAIVMGIGFTGWSVYWNYQKKRLEYEERRILIEKGITPPPVLPDPKGGPWTLNDSLRTGIIMFSLGVGLGIGYAVLHFTGDGGGRGIARLLAISAPIVMLLGVGNLVYYVVARRSEDQP